MKENPKTIDRSTYCPSRLNFWNESYSIACHLKSIELPPEQAGFRKGRSCAEQVLSLTNYSESGYQQGLKTGLTLIDLTAAYDTVWKQGLLFKLITPSHVWRSAISYATCLHSKNILHK